MVKNKLVKKNSIPFLLLAVVHVLLFVIFAKRSRQKNIWILLLSNIGMAYLFEYPVLNLFKAYAYKPYILKKRAHDQILGAIFSQALYVPITATLLTLYEKNRYWKLGSTLVYYGVERYFLHLEIYKAYWWKPYYTVFFMNIYFYISDWFHKALKREKRMGADDRTIPVNRSNRGYLALYICGQQESQVWTGNPPLMGGAFYPCSALQSDSVHFTGQKFHETWTVAKTHHVPGLLGRGYAAGTDRPVETAVKQALEYHFSCSHDHYL